MGAGSLKGAGALTMAFQIERAYSWIGHTQYVKTGVFFIQFGQLNQLRQNVDCQC